MTAQKSLKVSYDYKDTHSVLGEPFFRQPSEEKRTMYRLCVKRRGGWSFICEHESLPLAEMAAEDEMKAADVIDYRIKPRPYVPCPGEYLEDPEAEDAEPQADAEEVSANENGKGAILFAA
jgi:hypothetical protein